MDQRAGILLGLGALVGALTLSANPPVPPRPLRSSPSLGAYPRITVLPPGARPAGCQGCPCAGNCPGARA